MDKKQRFHWGVTAFLTVAALLVFYDSVFRQGVLLSLLHTFVVSLRPVIYGAAMAYLLAPMVNFFESFIVRAAGKRGGRGLARAGAILLAWAVVAFAFYLFFSILIPQLYQSVVMLANNMQSYYNTVYSWVEKLLDDNPQLAGVVSDMIDEYWADLRAWFTGKFLPQAQQTITAVTSGVVSVLLFFKDFFIGMIVSVYLLALKEKFALNARKLLYSAVNEENYHAALRALRKAHGIFNGFVRGKLLDSLLIGILCFIGASFLKLPYTPLISVVVGVTNLIPFFGPFLGAIPCAFLILLISPIKCLYFIIFIFVLQQIDGNVIGPKILGDSTELSGFWVIVAILLGGGFFGVLGMFLGVPVFACLHALVNYHRDKRLRMKGVETDELFHSNDAARVYRPDEKKEP